MRIAKPLRNKKIEFLIAKWLVVLAIVLLTLLIAKESGILQLLIPKIKNLSAILTAASLILVFLAAFISYYEYHGLGSQEGIIRRGHPGLPFVSLTFDDGPSPIYTPRILDILKEKEVKATFFLTGKHIDKYPGVAKRIINEGHEVGNHTYNHRELFPTRKTVIKNQIRKADNAIFRHLGIKTALFRPPRGIYTNAVRQFLVNEGYHMVLWTISSVDWRGLSPKKIAYRVERFARNGSIILFHDSGALIKAEGASRENTVKALPLVIDLLRDSGYQFIPVGKMLALSDSEEPSFAVASE